MTINTTNSRYEVWVKIGTSDRQELATHTLKAAKVEASHLKSFYEKRNPKTTIVSRVVDMQKEQVVFTA